jgi:phage-related protein
MELERPLKVVFFKTSAGNEPVREWLKGLTREESHIIGEDLLTVQYAWPVGKPLVDHLGDGVWELRSRLPTRVARTLFMVAGGAIVVLHGFIKKTRKTPARELELARQRQRQYEEPYD